MPAKYLDPSENVTEFILSPEERELLEEAFYEFAEDQELEIYEEEIENVQNLEQVDSEFLWESERVVDLAKLYNPARFNDVYVRLTENIKNLPAPRDYTYDPEDEKDAAFYDLHPDIDFSPIFSPEEAEEKIKEFEKVDEMGVREREEFAGLDEEQYKTLEEAFDLDVGQEVIQAIVDYLMSGEHVDLDEYKKTALRRITEMYNKQQIDPEVKDWMVDLVLSGRKPEIK